MKREYCRGWPPMDAPRRNIAAVGRWGRNSRASCHRRALRNAPGHNLATTGRPRRTPHAPRPHGSRSAHGAERPLVPCRSAMYRNVMHRSATDARAECPAPRLPFGPRRRTPPSPYVSTCPTLFPRPARCGTTAPCAVRSAFAATEKVSCGLRVSMRWNEPPVSV